MRRLARAHNPSRVGSTTGHAKSTEHLDRATTPSSPSELPDQFSPRHLRNRLVQVAIVVIAGAIVIKVVPGLSNVASVFNHAKPVWLVVAGLLEVGSMLSYVVIFRGVFCPRMGRGMSFLIALSEQAANSLLPSGGVGGLALGGWALHRGGMSTGHIERRSVAFFFLTSAANVSALAVFGIAMGLGLFARSEPWTLTFLPAAVALLAIGAVLMFVRTRRNTSTDKPTRNANPWRLRLRAVEVTLQDGTREAVELLRTGDRAIIAGSVGYLGFDIGALAACFAAYGSVPALSALVVAYVIGQLGAEIPVPGGIGGLDVGLVGMFVVYGTSAALATAAVLSFHAFLLFIPAVTGSIAFVRLRQVLLTASEPAVVCRPLAADAQLARVSVQPRAN